MAKQSSRASSGPRHSWRENAREFLIVVAGVFVALVAQQAVEAWDWHRKVDASETVLDITEVTCLRDQIIVE